MDSKNRVRNEAYLKMKQIRNDLELAVDDSDPFEELFETLTDMQKIMFVLLEYSLSPRFIYTHLGISRQRFSQVLLEIRRKITKYLVEKGNEL